MIKCERECYATGTAEGDVTLGDALEAIARLVAASDKYRVEFHEFETSVSLTIITELVVNVGEVGKVYIPPCRQDVVGAVQRYTFVADGQTNEFELLCSLVVPFMLLNPMLCEPQVIVELSEKHRVLV